MTVIAVIPARLNSTRLPGKVLATIDGSPMVHHVYQRTQQARLIDRVIIATDSEQVLQICADMGDQVVMTDLDHPSGSDRVAEAVSEFKPDLIINVQGDEPAIDSQLLDELVRLMQAHSDLVMGTAGSTDLTDADLTDENIVKVLERASLAIDFYRTLPDDLPAGHLLRHIGLYAYQSDFLQEFTRLPRSARERTLKLEQLRALDRGVRIGIVTTDFTGRGVDTPDDLARVRSTLKAGNS